MKFVAFFCAFLFLTLGSWPAFSQSALQFLDQKKKKAAPTPAMIDESFTVYDECKATDMTTRYYDCDCQAANFLDMRAQYPDAKQRDLVIASRKGCANIVTIAGESYKYCMGWAPRIRPDYKSYCECYGNAFAKNFTDKPTDNIKGRERLVTAALNSCNKGATQAEQQARAREIKQLQEQGLYNQLFPGTKIQTPGVNPAPRQ